MARPDPNVLFSRSIAAGYDPAVLGASSVYIPGNGAAGCNLALLLSLSGVRHLLCADDDVVQLHNAPGHPLTLPADLAGGRTPKKAKQVAQGFLRHSYSPEATAGYAVSRFQPLGTAPLFASSATGASVDSQRGRAELADLSRLAGKPLGIVGFSGERGYVSLWPNDDPEAPCWRCLHPAISTSPSFSCSDVARAQIDQGFVPSIENAAACLVAILAEALVLACHGKFPLANKTLFLNMRTGEAETVEVRRNPSCPGVHDIARDPTPLPFGVDASAAELLDEAARLLPGGRVRLRWPTLLETPCHRCGAPVRPMRPLFDQGAAVACKGCNGKPAARGLHRVCYWLDRSFAHPNMALRKLGFAPGTLVELEDDEGRRAYATLRGGIGDLFTLKRASNRNGGAPSGDSSAEAEPTPTSDATSDPPASTSSDSSEEH